jgi:hypothetical protein
MQEGVGLDVDLVAVATSQFSARDVDDIVVMKVHVEALYQFQKSFPSHSARRRLPESARVEVLLWRSFLLSLHVNLASFARPFQSFRVRLATHMIEYDASLTGMDV